MNRLLVCAALLALSALPAHAQAYVGTWASDPAQCRNGQEAEDAPLVMRANGYDQHEAHCTFSAIARRGTAWDVKARCRVEGNMQNETFRLEVVGNTLTISGRTLQRCN